MANAETHRLSMANTSDNNTIQLSLRSIGDKVPKIAEEMMAVVLYLYKY